MHAVMLARTYSHAERPVGYHVRALQARNHTLTARAARDKEVLFAERAARDGTCEMLLVLASRAPGGASSAARTPLHPSGVSGAAYGVAARRGAPRAADYRETHERTQTVHFLRECISSKGVTHEVASRDCSGMQIPIHSHT